MKPVYGADFCCAVHALRQTHDTSRSQWRGLGYVHCRRVQRSYFADSLAKVNELSAVDHFRSSTRHPMVFWRQTSALEAIVRSPLQLLDELQDTLNRFALPMHMTYPVFVFVLHYFNNCRLDSRSQCHQ